MTPSLKTYALSQIRITEIMYDPLGSGDKEFIEIYNGSDSTVDLSGWSFKSGVTYTFPSASKLQAGQYGVVVRNSVQFRSSYPNARILGQYTGKLIGRGELISLADRSSSIVTKVDYRSGAGWPTEPRNGGPSLSLSKPDADETVAACWGYSTVTGGSPGFTNTTRGSGSGCPTKAYPTTSVSPQSTPKSTGGTTGQSGKQSPGGQKPTQSQPQQGQSASLESQGDQELQNITPEKQKELDQQSKLEDKEDSLQDAPASQPTFKKYIGIMIAVFISIMGASYILVEKFHHHDGSASKAARKKIRSLHAKIRSLGIHARQ